MNEQYIFTGYRRIDIPTYGLKPGQLVAVGSKPSGGKTSFALDCALHASGKQEIPTIYFSLEMSEHYLKKRILLKSPSIPAKLFIDDTPALSTDAFEIKLKDAIVEHGVRLAIIDYVQLMNWPGDPLHSRFDELAVTVQRLKQCADNLGITIIILSQMSKYAVDGSLFRESPEIEKQSDVIIILENYIPNVKKRAEPKIPLKEDGSLDIERINNLPIEEFMDVLSSFSPEQHEEYIATIPKNASHEPVQPVIVDYSLEEAIEWGMVIEADKLFEDMKKNYGVKKEKD